MKKNIKNQRQIRHKRVRAKVIGTTERPRLSVFRSNNHIFLQLIDDSKGKTIVSASDHKTKKKTNKTEKAKEAGRELAKSAKTKKIETAVFDRGGYKYHGRIKAAAEGAREEGLKF
jgi:large subunit ribosomal protein L18